jgi:hypothetical protein
MLKLVFRFARTGTPSRSRAKRVDPMSVMEDYVAAESKTAKFLQEYREVLADAKHCLNKLENYDEVQIEDRSRLLVADGIREAQCHPSKCFESSQWPSIKKIDDALTYYRKARDGQRHLASQMTDDQKKALRIY